MHRRQYLPGSQVKLNRDRLFEDVKQLREANRELVNGIAYRNAALKRWEDEAIERGWRALLAWIIRFLTRPFSRRRSPATA